MERSIHYSNSNEKANYNKNDPQQIEEMERIEKEKQELALLRARYNRHVFNKKMIDYYIDLNQSQKECDESIKYLNSKRDALLPNKSHDPFSNQNLSSSNSKLIKITQYNPKGFFNNFNSTINNNTSSNTKSLFKLTGKMGKNNSVIKTKITLDRTMTNTKTKLQKSLSQCNFYSRPKQTIKKSNIAFPRRKNYKVVYDVNWSKRNGFIDKKENSLKTYTNQFYQKQLITSELLVIYDNHSTFRMTYVDDLMSVSININEKFIRCINIIIEETCGLMVEIVHLFLWDFIQYYSLIGKPKPTFPSCPNDNAVVSDEVNELKINLKELNEITYFLKETNEIYSLLTAQLTNLVLTLDNMIKIKQYLARCRFNISKLIFTSKSYIDNYNFDEEAYGKYKNKILKINKSNSCIYFYNDNKDNDKEKEIVIENENENETSKLKESNSKKRFGYFKKHNGETERIRRLQALLNS